MNEILQWLPPELSLQSALILVATSFVTSAISATFGLGGGIAMLVVLLSQLPPLLALPVHALVQVGSNAGRAWMMRSSILGKPCLWFLPGSILGIVLASQLVVAVPVSAMQLLLAIFILTSIWIPAFSKRTASDRSFLIIGAATSFASMFLGATGPLLAAFLSPTRYGRDATVATHATCMTLQHLLKLLAFGLLGFVLAPWLPIILSMILSGLLGTHLGRSLLSRMPEHTFGLIFRTLLSLLALRLVYQAVGG